MPLPGNIQQIWVGSDNWLDSNGGVLLGKTLRVIPTADRLNDAGARAIIMSVPAETNVDSLGVAWVKVPATDDADLNPGTYTLGVSEPTGESYFIFGPSSSPVETHDDGSGAVALPTVDLSQDVTKAPAPVPGLAQIMRGIGITSVAITGGHMIVTYDDGTTQDAGAIAGSGAVDSVQGKTGVITDLGPADLSPAGVTATDSRLTNARTPTAHHTTHSTGGSDAIAAGDIGAFAASQMGVAGGGATLGLDGLLTEAQRPPGGSGSGTVVTINGESPDGSGNIALSPGDLSPAAIAVGDALTPSSLPSTNGSASIALRPVNVRDQANPLANAVMDGATHPLSSRFGSLSEAQVVFPSAVALTDEIDYWAIQSLLSSKPAVDLSWGTAVLHKSLLYPANIAIRGFGDRGATILTLRSGANSNILTPADLTNENPGVLMADFTVDGNKANNTGPIGQTDGIQVFRGKDLKLRDIEARNMNGRGIHVQSVTGTVCQVAEIDVYCHDNMHWGLWVTNGVRKVQYGKVTCNNNGLRTDISRTNTGNNADSFTGGMLLDHSESSGHDFQMHNNSQYGLFIRNVFGCNISGIRTTQNGQHGIRVLGMVDSQSSDWLSQANGQDSAITGDSRDIWFDGTTSLNYGITARCKLDNIQAGPSASAAIASQGSYTSPEDWAIYFDDAMSGSDIEIHTYTKPGAVGDVRFPTAGTGTMLYGNGPSGLDKVSNNLTSGSAYTLPDVNVAQMHRVVLTANCTITIPPAAAGKVISVSLVQDSTGSRTVTWAAATGTIKWAAGGTPPTLTTSAGGADAVAFECFDGSHWVGYVQGQNI